MKNKKLSPKATLQFVSVLMVVFALLVGITGLPLLAVQAQSTNLALNKPTTCSPSPQYPCANAVDGNLSTRWASAPGVDPQWISVDLGATYAIGQIILRWEAAYATAFQIQTSSDGVSWTSIYSTTTGTGGVQTLNVSGSGRYIRMFGTVRATAYGYSLWEFEVYGPIGGTITPTKTITSTRTNTPTPGGGSLPDLTITSITYVGSTPPCANNPRDNVVVSNIGSVDAGSFVVSFGPSMTQNVSSLAAGQSVTLSFPAIMGTSTATADSTNVIVESNEANNSMSASLPAPTQAPTCTPTKTATPTPTGPGMLPDLMISSVITAPQGWTGGCANDLIMGVRVTVRNAGTAAAGAFVVDVSGTQQTVSAGLAAGATISLWYARTGSLVITADSTNLVGEINEGNNTFSYVTITATPPVVCTRTPTPTMPSGSLPDLTVLSITEFTYNLPVPTLNPQGCWQPGKGTAIGLRITIQNIGATNAGSFVVNLLLNSTNYNQTVSSLPAGQTLAVDMYPTVALPRTRTATVDSTGLITESNETNNTFTLNLPNSPTVTPTATGTIPPTACVTTPTTGPTLTPTRTPTATTVVGCGTVVVVTSTPSPTYTPTPRTATATTTPSCGGPIYITATPTFTPTPTATVSSGGTNLALNKPVTCSSVENAGTACANAVDGNLTTRWSSAFSDPQWIRVDLLSAQSIGHVILRWQNSYGKSYQIQTSNDATTWTTIYSTTTGDGGVDDLTGLSGTARYIRMFGTVRFTTFGYSLWEFEVYN